MITKISDDVYIDREYVVALKRTIVYMRSFYNRAFGLEIYMKNGDTIILPNEYIKEEIDEIITIIIGDNKNESE